MAVLAKAPVPGRVKTRLCPPLTPAQAAELARAALLDTIEACSASAAREVVVILDGSPRPWMPAGIRVIAPRAAQVRGAPFGGGIEWLAGQVVPLRVGALWDSGRHATFLTAGLGFVSTSFALDVGYRHIDTAQIYGPFTNEELVGEALHGPSARFSLGCLDRTESLGRDASTVCEIARGPASLSP